VYGIHNNHDHIDEGKRVKGDRGWEKGEGGRMERGGRQEIKEKRGRREKERRRVGEDYPMSSPS
jgi:hypothetical protein